MSSRDSALIEKLSIKEHELLDVLPVPNPQADISNWYELYSPQSLRLTLHHILEDCKLPNKKILEAFPLFLETSNGLDSANRIVSPCPARVNVDNDKLTLTVLQLKAVVDLYKNHIQWLSTASRLHFGELKGSKVAILIETSDQMFQREYFVKEFLELLNQFLEEQLVKKEAVYLIQFGSAPSPTSPTPLFFSVNCAESTLLASELISSLSPSGGCDVMGALNVALELSGLDTIMLILSSQPNQDVQVMKDYMVNQLNGAGSPRLHLVAYHCSSDRLKSSLSQIAHETHDLFHSISVRSTCNSPCDGDDSERKYIVEDSDIAFIQEWIDSTNTVHYELCNLLSGMITDDLMEVLRQLYLSTSIDCIRAPPTGIHCIQCSSQSWIKTHGIESNGLNLYTFLAPYAYSRLEEHVDSINRTAISQVYEVMPLFRWHDGTFKHLNVSVHNFETYVKHLKDFLSSTLQPRLNWLLSGSQFPLGVLTEPRALVVVDCSYVALPNILLFQQHLKMLLEEQLVHVKEFNLMRFGGEYCLLSNCFIEPTYDSLTDSWEWILGMSPSGISDLLSVCKMIFEGDKVLTQDEKEEGVGIYFILSAPPNQENDMLCSYLEQHLAGSKVHLNVVYYDTEISSETIPKIIPGLDGGTYLCENEVKSHFKELAKTGRGRFHHFRVSGCADGDDLDLMMSEINQAQAYLQTIRKVLDDYREFCRRNVSPPEPLEGSASHTCKSVQPLPLYPRPTTTSLARMSACYQRLEISATGSAITSPPKCSKPPQCITTRSYYTGQGLKKVTIHEHSIKASSKKTKKSPLIPSKEENISSQQWLSKYSLDRLGLSFKDMAHKKSSPKSGGVSYKHINHQGEVFDFKISQKSLKNYASQLHSVISCYQKRMEWLKRDDHKLLGVVIERDVIILLDISSSVSPYWTEMRKGLLDLLHMFPPKVKTFNIITFASSVFKFAEEQVTTEQHNINQAHKWLEAVKTGGCSCLLDAVKVSIQSGAKGIYLVTDGAVNHTHQFLLNQIPMLRKQFGEYWRINTVAFHSSESHAQSFLRDLAQATGGRYYCYSGDSSLSGDDIEMLHRETCLALSYLKQAKDFL